MPTPKDLRFFPTPGALRRWLHRHHPSADELWVGYYKRSTGKPSVTWPESVDEALCVGWIDGIRRRIDDEAYAIRFTPRRQGSIWSRVNIRRVEFLTAEGRMLPAGVKAFEARLDTRSGVYSYEQEPDVPLDPALARRFQGHRAAWTFFAAQPPGYRKLVTRWIMSAKRDETRLSRVDKAIAVSANGRRLF